MRRIKGKIRTGPGAAWRASVRDVRASRGRRQRVLSWLLLVIIVVVLLESWQTRPWRQTVLLALAFAGIYALRLLPRGMRMFDIKEAFLAERRCAACGYDLSRTEPESDGCTVCAECGGAWKLPRGDEQREGG